MKTLESVQRGVLSLILRPLKSPSTSSLEAELNVQPINIQLQELVLMESLKIMRKTAKNSMTNASKNHGTFLSPLQNLSKQGKKHLFCISGQTNIETILLEPEPSSTRTTLSSIIRKDPTLDIPLSKEEKKINQIVYVKAQISDTNENTVAIFTDGSCIGNPGPTGAGAVIFKNVLNKPAIKLWVKQYQITAKTIHKLSC